jgi:hypothetical protein
VGRGTLLRRPPRSASVSVQASESPSTIYIRGARKVTQLDLANTSGFTDVQILAAVNPAATVPLLDSHGSIRSSNPDFSHPDVPLQQLRGVSGRSYRGN